MSAGSSPMRIVLASMGVDEFSLLHDACEQAGHTPVAYAYSKSMRPRQPSDPYAMRAIQRMLESIPSTDLLLPADTAGLGAAMAGYQPDLLVIYGFNWILPPAVFDIPRFGAINIHPSLLPRYRGPAPELWAIRNGDADLGVSVHQVDEGVDTGPILASRGGIRLEDQVTRETLNERIRPTIHDLLITALDKVAQGARGEPQPDEGQSHAPLMEPEFNRVDWSRTRSEVHNQVRVFRYMGRKDAPIALVEDRWLYLIRTSLAPSDGERVECADGPIWIVEATSATPPFTGARSDE